MVTKRKDSTLEKNRALAHRFHQEIIQEYNLKLADEIIAADCAFHSPLSAPTDLKGPERAKRAARRDRELYPKGIKFVHDVTLAEGDLVAFHWLGTGTKESGEIVKSEGIDIVRIRNGKVAEMWIEFHQVGGQ